MKYDKSEFSICENFNGYYIAAGRSYKAVYLHKDGTVHSSCGYENFWDSKKEAKEFLDEWKGAHIVDLSKAFPGPTFGDVQLNEFFVDTNGSLLQKVGVNTGQVRALANGEAVPSCDHRFASETKINRVVGKIKFKL